MVVKKNLGVRKSGLRKKVQKCRGNNHKGGKQKVVRKGKVMRAPAQTGGINAIFG